MNSSELMEKSLLIEKLNNEYKGKSHNGKIISYIEYYNKNGEDLFEINFVDGEYNHIFNIKDIGQE